MGNNKLLSLDVIKIMDIDILDINEKILSNFNDEKNRLPEYKKSLTELKETVNQKLKPRVTNNLIKTIERMDEYIIDLELDKLKNFYILETLELLDSYKSILNKPEKQFFCGSIKKTDKNKKKIVALYLTISKKYSMMIDSDLPYIYPERNVKILCNNCDSKEFDIEEGNIYVCVKCSSQQYILNNVTSFKDIKRINISSKYCYDRRVHFRDCINQYQGKQNSFISPKIYNDLINQFELHQILNLNETNKKKKFAKIKKDHLYIFLKELGHTKHYENINLIYYNITGVKPDDIGYLETKLMNDFDTITDAYDRLFKHLDRKNFINTQYILYQLLIRHKHPCKKDDFSILKTIERKNFHDDICKILFEDIKFTFTPLY